MGGVSYGQIESCGSDVITEGYYSQFPHLRKEKSSFQIAYENTMQQGQPEGEDDEYLVPVVVHIMYENEDGAENISDEQVDKAILNLNQRYAGNAGGSDSKIRFELAKVDPSGHCTNGIVRVKTAVSKGYYNFNETAKDIALKDLSRWNPKKFLNVWVVSCIVAGPDPNNTDPCHPAARAYSFVFDESVGGPIEDIDGVVIRSDEMNETSVVLAHEVGHYLYLYHVNGKPSSTPCVDNCHSDDDCLILGDKVCDTQQTKSSQTTVSGCGPIETSCVSCDAAYFSGRLYPRENYMAAASINNDCRTQFSDGQIERMRFCLENARKELLAPNEVVVSSANATWPLMGVRFDYPINKLTIESGAKLTVPANYRLFFTMNGFLDIKPNGELDLFGGLTSCNTWKGVRMKGSATGNSTILTNPNSVIEHAEIGIANSGECQITANGKFLNNKTAISLVGQSSNVNDWLSDEAFEHSTFEINDDFRFPFDYINSNNNRLEFVSLTDLRNVTFKGCDFINNLSRNGLSPEPYRWEVNGIVSSNSKFEVNETNNGFPCSFTKLFSGIEAYGMGGTSDFKVRKAKFNQCSTGIMSNKVTNAKITLNTFNMGQNVYNADEFVTDYLVIYPQIGVHFQGGTNGFILQDNTFDRTINGNGVSWDNMFGGHFASLGASDVNLVRRNKYIGLSVGNYAQGVNANMDEGLNFNCNENNVGNNANTSLDFIAAGFEPDVLAVRHDIVAYDNQFKELPARNTFSQGANDYDVDHFWSLGYQGYNYYYDPNQFHWVSGDETPTLISGINADNYLQGITNGCTQEHFFVRPIEEVEEKYLEYSDLYHKSKEEYRLALQQGTTAEQETTRRLVSKYRHGMSDAAYQGYRYAVEGDGRNRELIRKWLRRFDNQTGDYMLIEDYLETAEYEMARRTLNRMEQSYEFTIDERDDFLDRNMVYNDLIVADGNQLGDDVLNRLERIAIKDKGQTRFLARSILAKYGVFFSPVFTELDINGSHGSSGEKTHKASKRMDVSPNPTDYNVLFDWSKHFSNRGEVVIEILNQTGGLIEVLKPSKGVTSQEWTTEKVSGSVCYYRLLVNGEEVDFGHIIINK